MNKKIIYTLLLILFIMLCPASLMAQEQIVTLTGDNITLKTAFEQIEKQTGLSIDYDANTVDVSQKIKSLPKSNKVSLVLDALLKETGYIYKFNKSHVIIIASSQNPTSEKNDSSTSSKRILKGKVVDEKGESIIGTNVWIKESSEGTVTDIDGNFSLPVTGFVGQICFSYIGYETQEVVVGDRVEFNITLQPVSSALKEVVVVGYGTQRKESVVGAISSIDASQLKLPTGKMSNILAGRLAGLVSVNRTGEPGAGSSFYIRGISTFGANKDPLVLVDGIERSLDLVDPEDIESFSILRDATATAVYGVRGANGVIIITTRAGQEGKTKIDIRAETGMTGPTQMPKLVNSVQFANMYNEALGYEFYTQDVINKYKTGEDLDMYPNINWLNTLFNDFAHTRKVNANFSGGGRIARYYIAGSYYNEGSIFKDFKNDNAIGYNASLNYNKVNFRANVDLNLTKSTVLNVNLANVYETKHRPNHSLSEIWALAFTISPNALPVRYSDGKLAHLSAGGNPYNMLAQTGYADDYWNSAQALVGLTQDFGEIITPGLKANIKFSWDAYNSGTITRAYNPALYIMQGRDSEGNPVYTNPVVGSEGLGYGRSLDGNRTNYLEVSAVYDRILGVHRFGGLVLYNQKEKTYLNASTAMYSLPYRNQGIAGRVTYSLFDRYFAEFNMGYNGSENFAKGRRFGLFPAYAAGWLLSEENFWAPLKNTIDIFKLKASYGTVGNDQIGGGRRFMFQETLVTEGATGNYGGYFWGKEGEHNVSRIYMGDPANTSVSWEKSHKLNIGLQLSFFKSLKLEIDYFKENREGIFLQRGSLPYYGGFTVIPYANVGKMDNEGFDASLQFNKKIGQIQLSAIGNFTFARNTVIDNDQPNYKWPYQDRKGKPLNQPFGMVALGLFQTQEEIDGWYEQFGDKSTLKIGDIKYKDVNEDGVINSEDQVALGYPEIPEIVYGFGATVAWKGIDLSVFFQGVARTSIIMSGHAVYGFSGRGAVEAGMYEYIYQNRWTPENPNSEYPRIHTEKNPNNHQLSSYWLKDGSFLRLKNIELGYTIPKTLINNWPVSYIRFYATGVNVLTFSSFKLWDPELGSGQGAGYPPNSVFSFGLNINF